jgi:predicted nicotinamide N-methyase
VWESASNMAAFLAGRPSLVAGRSVCELGCGLGVPSLVAAKHAESVVATDISQNAVDALLAVARVNGMPSSLTARTLDWFDCLRADFITPIELIADVLLLADVNYFSTAVPALVATCDLLCRPGGLLILGSKIGRIGLAEFRSALAQSRAGGYVAEEEHDVSAEHHIWLFRRAGTTAA